MSLWNWLTRRRADHGWPGYIINGRIRTSTAALILAFFALTWVHNNYQPPPPAPAPETSVVPPGFVPDPAYTWVPRTNVQTRQTTTEPTTTETTETTEPSGTETTTPSPGETTTSGVPTTVIDPDGPGPMPPTTVTETTAPTSVSTVPNRSGTPTVPTTTAGTTPGSTPATPPPGQ